MAQNVFFKKGLLANLPSSYAAGTFYVTTDERAMYLDIDDSTRIRLGDFIQVDAVANLPTDGASTSALYYCVAENILAKWNGSTWTQINKQPTAEEMKTLLGLGSMAYLSEVAEDNLSTALKEKVNAAAEGNHSHSNKTVLDGITAEKVADWDDAVSKEHTHSFADEAALNGITAAKVADWDDAVSKEHTHTFVDADVEDAIAKKHSHTFVESELNKIAAGDVAKWNGVVADHLTSADKTEIEDAIGDVNTALENYKTSNNEALAGVKATAEAAATKDYTDAELAKKVAKTDYEADKATFATKTDIAKLAGVSEGANKVEASANNGSIKIDGVETVVYTHPEKHAIADVTGLQDALDGKQAAGNYSVEGHKHVKADITDFAHTHTASEVTDLDATIKAYGYATTSALNDVDAKFADYTKTADLPTDLGDFTNNAGYAKTADVNTELDKKADKTQVATDIANAIAPLATTETLNGVKATAEAATTVEEVDTQIDAKIAALNLGTTYEPIGAEQRAKDYVDGKFTDANLDQYTTEQEVKDIVDTVIAGAVDGDTITGLANLVEYLNTHGAEAKEMGAAIDVLEGKVETIEGKPAYNITATQISNWDNEVGAKALAETKTTTAEVKDQIEAYGYATTGYADGKASDAQAAAIADAAEKYETKGTAQGIVDALKLSETYEPIGAETRAIAAAKIETENQVKDLAGEGNTSTVKKNADDIASLFEQMTWGSF